MEASKRPISGLVVSAFLLALACTGRARAAESLADPQTAGCRTPDAIAGFLSQHITESEHTQIAQRENIRRTDLCLLPTDILRRSVEAVRKPQVRSPEWGAAQASRRAVASSEIRKSATPLQWVNDSPGSHGTVLQIFQNLTTDNELVMFMKGGEVWSSKNNGDTWSLHSNSPYTQHIQSVAQGKLNPKLLVASSHWVVNQNFEYDFIKSEDGGRSWKRLNFGFNGEWISNVLIDEVEKSIQVLSDHKFHQFDFDGNLVFAAAATPMYNLPAILHKNEESIVQFGSKGIFYSEDNGRTWNNSSVDNPDDIEFPANYDAKLVSADSDPKTLYIVVNQPGSVVTGPKNALLRSRDGGKTFGTINRNGYTHIAVNPANADHIFMFTNTFALESLDGGKTTISFTSILLNPQHQPHIRHISLASDFWTSKKVVFLDTEDGVFQLAFDSNQKAKPLTDSASTGPIYEIKVTANGSPAFGNFVMYPTGRLILNSSWSLKPHPLNDDVLLDGTSATWNAGNSFVHFVAPGFYRPHIIRQNQTYHAAYFGNKEIYVCGSCLPENSEPSHSVSSNLPSTVELIPSELEPNLYLARDWNYAALIKSPTVKGAIPESINLHNLPEACCWYQTRLSAHTPGLVFAVARSEYKPTAIYATGDFGISWLPQVPLPADFGVVLDFTPSPHDPQTFYVAGTSRLIMTKDGGKTWFDIAPAPSRFETLHIENGYLFVGTSSRGRWRAPIISRSKPEKLYVRPALKVARDTQVTSTPVLFGTITAPATLAVKNGQHSVGCTSSYTDTSVTVQPFDKVCFRHQSSGEFGATQTTEIGISGFKTSFVSTTEVDEVPDPFTIPAAYDAEPAKPVTSAAVTIKGFGPDAPISIFGGQYSINCTDEFRSSASRITNEARVCVRHTSAAQADEFYSSVLTVGGVSAWFTSKTVGDIAPDALSFASKNEVPPDTWVISESKIITGLSSDAAISVTGGEYSIGCTGTFTSTSSRITNGQSVCLRHRAATTPAAQTVTTLNVGSATARFESLTAEDRSPDAFSFAQQSSVALSSVVVSETVTISGISTAVAIRIIGGEYSLGCTGTFISADGLIKNGENVCVRHTSSALHSTTTKTTLSVGDRQAEFVSTTLAKPEPANGGGGGGGGGGAGFLLLGLALIRLAKRSH